MFLLPLVACMYSEGYNLCHSKRSLFGVPVDCKILCEDKFGVVNRSTDRARANVFHIESSTN